MNLLLRAAIWAITMALSSISVYGQLGVTVSNNANDLAQHLAGPGVIISNAQLLCGDGAAGYFDGVNSNIGLDSGVILSSGLIINAVGPNNSPGGAYDNMNQPGDPLLDQLAGVTTFDRCELRFDVTPFSDTMSFNYVFASEEYPEYVCSNFNDVFGFFISGLNPSGGTFTNLNVALIPGTNIAVAINSVNSGLPGPQYSPSGCVSLGYSQYYVDNTGGQTVQYDGFTVRLEATIPVVKCSTYAMRLMIGDGGDRVWNSGVFLEAGSLSSQGVTVIAQTTNPSAYQNMIEGCLNGELVFHRNSSNINSDQVVYITIGGTATNCIDYSCIPDSIIIPAGQDSFLLSIIAFSDTIPEGFESIKIYITLPCAQGIIDSALIYIVDSLSITILPGDTSICIGNSVQLQAIGGGSFQWAPPAGLNVTLISTPTATPQVTTTYTVSSSISTCSATNTITITVVDTPSISAGPDTTICIGTSYLMNATGVADSFLWTPTTNMSNPLVQNPTVFPFVSTSYTLIATSGGICADTSDITITVAPLPIIIAGPNRTICFGDSVQLQAIGGESYVWSPIAGLSNPYISNPLAKPMATTSYTVTAIDSNGCSRNALVQITVLPGPPLNAGPNTTICAGDTVNLFSATGGTSYLWKPVTALSDSTIHNPVAWPGSSTTYTLAVAGSNGCLSLDSVTITVNQLPVISTSVLPGVVCQGSVVQLQATGGTSYVWKPASAVSNPFIPNPVSTVFNTTVFTVTVSDNNGCIDSANLTANVYSPIISSAGGNDSICLGDSIQLNASGGAIYLWTPAFFLSNPNIGNPIASPTGTTTYTLAVFDSNGCSRTDQITITVLPLPAAYAGPDRTVCEGAPTNLLASGGSQYLWTPSIGLSCTNCPIPTLIPTASTIYSVEVSDQYGCMATSSVSITVIPLMSTTISANPSGVCPGGTVQLGITGGANWQWSPAASLTNANSANPIATPPTTMWYYVNSTDVTGCVKTDSILVTVFDLANLSAGNDTALCIGQSIGLQAVGASTYSWAPATGLSNPSIANPVASPVATTTYTLTGIDANNCSKDTTITITVNPLPTANAGTDHLVCPGTMVQLNGSGGVSYLWTPVTGLSCTGCPNPQLIATNNVNYVLQVTDVNGCMDFDTVEVTLLPIPTVRANRDTTICTGTSVQLSATGAVSYQWQPATALNNSAIANPVCTPSGPITYTVTGTGTNSCTSTDSVTIRLHPVVPVDAGPGGSICGNDSLRLQASNAITYHWEPAAYLDDPTIASPMSSPGATTTFTVTGRDLNTCPTYDSVIVTVFPTPNIALNVTDTTLCPGVPLQLIATGATNYTWTPATGLSNATIANPVASPTIPLVYTVMSTDPTSGCMDSATVTINLYPHSDPNAHPPQASICPGDFVQLLAENGVYYRWEPPAGLDNASVADPLASPNSTTIYTVTITDSNGCDFSDEVDILVLPAPIADAGPDKNVQYGHSVMLDGFGNGTFSWSPALWLSDPTEATPYSKPDASITYYLTVTTIEGCTAMDSVFVNMFIPTKVVAPNAFSPNGDGQNDVFQPISWHKFEMDLFQVFDRWGQIVFSSTDPNGYWDGTIGGQPAQMGVYVFTISGRGNQGEPIFIQGNVTLVR